MLEKTSKIIESSHQPFPPCLSLWTN